MTTCDATTNTCVTTATVAVPPTPVPVVPPVGAGSSAVSTVSTAVMIVAAMPYFFKGFGFGISLLFPIQGVRFLLKKVYNK